MPIKTSVAGAFSRLKDMGVLGQVPSPNVRKKKKEEDKATKICSFSCDQFSIKGLISPTAEDTRRRPKKFAASE